MLTITSHMFTIHLVVFYFFYTLSQFLNRMNKMKGATSKPVLHSTLEVVQDLDDCLTEPVNTRDGLQADK